MHAKHYPNYFLVPVLVLYFVFLILPSLLGIGYSLTDWNTYSEEINYVGFENFRQIFSLEENYLAYIANTLVFTAVTTVLKTVIGLGLAILLSEGVRRFTNLYRLAIYLPARPGPSMSSWAASISMRWPCPGSSIPGSRSTR
jgi:raffinose/stachyose/melibiose transport system permease protein